MLYDIIHFTRVHEFVEKRTKVIIKEFIWNGQGNNSHLQRNVRKLLSMTVKDRSHLLGF